MTTDAPQPAGGSGTTEYANDPWTGWLTESPDYPRRQFQRETWMNLDGEWRFTFDEAGRARHPRHVAEWDRTIRVPFAPESAASGIGDQSFHPDAWYSREFLLDLDPGHRALLHFGAVDYETQVWVDDTFVGRHEGGHTSFTFDVTEALAEGPTHTVTVWAHDNPHNLAKPRGKQDWQEQPHLIWYPRTTGIWQTVWLETVPEQHVDRITWAPDLDRWRIGFEAYVRGPVRDGVELRVTLSVGDKLLAEDRYRVLENEVHRSIALSDPGIDDYRNELLWSPRKPTLIDARIELLRDGVVVDRIRSYTALRDLAIDRGRLLLNNRPYVMRLVLDQGYWPDTLMTPPSEEAIIRDIELIKAAGFNGVRKHQKIEDPRFLHWADRLGLLVWEEMPSAYRYTHLSIERVMREWMEVIDRDANHPCIVTWVPFNESWGVPDLRDNEQHRHAVQALYHFTKTLDSTRPVIGNDGWENSATDILGIHDYDDNPDRVLERYGEGTDRLSDLLVNGWPGGRVLTLEGHPHQGQPIMLTEFGGIAQADPRQVQAAREWGYAVSSDVEDLRGRYERLLGAVNRSTSLAGFCYTQFTDTFQEINGLFFADRTPKFPLEAMQAATQGARRTPTAVSIDPTAPVPGFASD
jgi:beta-galactosidase/beta-glucuronidase